MLNDTTINHNGINSLDPANWTADQIGSTLEDRENPDELRGRCSMKIEDEVGDSTVDITVGRNTAEPPNEPSYDTCFGMVSRVTFCIQNPLDY